MQVLPLHPVLPQGNVSCYKPLCREVENCSVLLPLSREGLGVESLRSKVDLWSGNWFPKDLSCLYVMWHLECVLKGQGQCCCTFVPMPH